MPGRGPLWGEPPRGESAKTDASEEGGGNILPKREDRVKERCQKRTFVRDWESPRKISAAGAAAAASTSRPASTKRAKRKRTSHHDGGREEGVRREREDLKKKTLEKTKKIKKTNNPKKRPF